MGLKNYPFPPLLIPGARFELKSPVWFFPRIARAAQSGLLPGDRLDPSEGFSGLHRGGRGLSAEPGKPRVTTGRWLQPQGRISPWHLFGPGSRKYIWAVLGLQQFV